METFLTEEQSNYEENPLNLNILLSGGKESNNDSCSNGE